MIVKDVMSPNVVVAKPNATIREAAKVMAAAKIGSLIVRKGEKIVGIVTERDLVAAIAKDNDTDETDLEDVMSKPVVTVEPSKTVEEAVDLMIEHKIKKLPVVSDGKLMGIITASDIVVVEPKLIASVANLISLRLPGYKGG